MKSHGPTKQVRPSWLLALILTGSISLIVIIGSATLSLGTTTVDDIYWRIAPHRLSVQSVSWSPDGKLLASSSQEGLLKVIDVANKQILVSREDIEGFIHEVSWSPDSEILAIAVSQPKDRLQLWHYGTNQTTLLPDRSSGADVISLSWSPDGTRLAVGRANSAPSGAKLGGSIDMYDVQSLTFTEVVTVSEPIMMADWSPNGRYLAAGYSAPNIYVPSPNVQVWDAATYQPVASYVHSSSVFSLAWAPDSDLLATGSIDGSVKIWSVNRKQTVADLIGHSIGVEALAWSPEGDYLASGSVDYSARLWEMPSGKHVKTLETPDYVNTLAYSPDGKFIAIGCQNGEILVWLVVGEGGRQPLTTDR